VCIDGNQYACALNETIPQVCICENLSFETICKFEIAAVWADKLGCVEEMRRWVGNEYSIGRETRKHTPNRCACTVPIEEHRTRASTRLCSRVSEVHGLRVVVVIEAVVRDGVVADDWRAAAHSCV
jgi:hypothetical protein